jgi:hypothetical protein
VLLQTLGLAAGILLPALFVRLRSEPGIAKLPAGSEFLLPRKLWKINIGGWTMAATLA